MFGSKKNVLSLPDLAENDPRSSQECQFPRITEAAHFHYEESKLKSLLITVKPCNSLSGKRDNAFEICVWSGHATWSVKKTIYEIYALDHQIHVCLFDRRFSGLQNLSADELMRPEIVDRYFKQLSDLMSIHGDSINCSLVLSWFELDNKGNNLVCGDLRSLNIPAIAAAQVVRRHIAESEEELNIEVGDLISLIDMPSSNENTWWRGKKGYKTGLFPSCCVVVIDTKKAAESAAHSAAVSTDEKLSAQICKPVLKNRGKIVSCLQILFRERPTRDHLRQSGIVFERVFGCDLGQYLANHNQEIPLIVRWCAEMIEKRFVVDGIYRHSGGHQNINALRLIFDTGKLPNENEMHTRDPHAVSSIMKSYFRELPNPLLTHALYFDFINAAGHDSEKDYIPAIQQLLKCLPPPHYRTLKFIAAHLSKIAAQSDVTGMTARNLAIVWAPNLLRPFLMSPKEALTFVLKQARVVEILISHFNALFDQNQSQGGPSNQNSLSNPIVLSNRNRSEPLTSFSSQQYLLPLDVAQELLGRKANVSSDVGGSMRNDAVDFATTAHLSTPQPPPPQPVLPQHGQEADGKTGSSAKKEGISKKYGLFLPNKWLGRLSEHSRSLRISHSDDNLRANGTRSSKKVSSAKVIGCGSVKTPNNSKSKCSHQLGSEEESVHKSNTIIPVAAGIPSVQRRSIWRTVPRSKSIPSPSFPVDADSACVADESASWTRDNGIAIACRTPHNIKPLRSRCPLTSDNSMVWTGSFAASAESPSSPLVRGSVPFSLSSSEKRSLDASKKAFLVRGPLTTFSPQLAKRHRSADELSFSDNNINNDDGDIIGYYQKHCTPAVVCPLTLFAAPGANVATSNNNDKPFDTTILAANSETALLSTAINNPAVSCCNDGATNEPIGDFSSLPIWCDSTTTTTYKSDGRYDLQRSLPDIFAHDVFATAALAVDNKKVAANDVKRNNDGGAEAMIEHATPIFPVVLEESIPRDDDDDDVDDESPTADERGRGRKSSVGSEQLLSSSSSLDQPHLDCGATLCSSSKTRCIEGVCLNSYSFHHHTVEQSNNQQRRLRGSVDEGSMVHNGFGMQFIQLRQQTEAGDSTRCVGGVGGSVLLNEEATPLSSNQFALASEGPRVKEMRLMFENSSIL